MSAAAPEQAVADVALPTAPEGLSAYGAWLSAVLAVLHAHQAKSRTFRAEAVDERLQRTLCAWRGIDYTLGADVVAHRALEAELDAAAAQAAATPRHTGKKAIGKTNYDAMRPFSAPQQDDIPEPPAGDGSAALKTFAGAWQDAWSASAAHKQLHGELKQSRELLRELATAGTASNEDGATSSGATWSLCRESEEDDGAVTRTFTRKEDDPEKPFWSLKVSGIIHADFESIFSVVYHPDLYPEWFPFMAACVEVAVLGRFRKMVHARVAAPWPLTDRDFALEAWGVDATESGRVLINISSTKDPRVPAETKKAVRGELHLGGYLLEMLRPGVVRVSFYCNVDAKLSAVPVTLTNWVSSRLVHMVVGAMGKAAKKVKTDPAYAKKAEENAEVYEDVRAIAAMCARAHEQQMQQQAVNE